METIAKDLRGQIIELALKREKSGIPLIDNILADNLDESRMATKEELEFKKYVDNDKKVA